jgi:mannose-1-phosphate guanylyltransferase
MPSHKSNLWTIVLAAGEGTRLRSLTRALHGEDRPKQFAFIDGESSLLQATLARAARFCRTDHTIVVVSENQEGLAREQLREYPLVQVVAQPKNAGTAPGILLPLLHVIAQDPEAEVVILASDHHVTDVEPFVESVREAVSVSRVRGSVVVVGAVPDRAETQYGWISPTEGGTANGLTVGRFLEKPDRPVAEDLFRSGALWNTFIMAGKASRFLHMMATHLAALTERFERYLHAIGTPWESRMRTSVYADLPSADFSRDVLEKAGELGLVALARCGWSDWGTPGRVFESLKGTPTLRALIDRLKGHGRSEFFVGDLVAM